MDKPPINLITNPYRSDDLDRQAELDFCERHNKYNHNIGSHTKIYAGRPTIREMIDAAEPKMLNVLANLDIVFDETLLAALVHCQKNPKDVLALCRYEMPGVPRSIESAKGYMDSSMFFDRADSQDVWIWWGKISLYSSYGHYPLGMPGCDNRLAYELQESGYRVVPASKSIKTYHVHCCQVRTYDRSQTIPGPYLTLPPTTL